MSLTLFTGRPNAGKTGRLYRPIIDAAARAGSPVVLLPSTPDARRAAREFSSRGISGVRTAVLDRWIAELWSLHGDGRRIVDSVAREALLMRACADRQLRALARSAGSPGFVRLLSALAERVPAVEEASARSPQEREIVAVLGRYEEILVRDGLIELSTASVLLGSASPRPEGPVAINRFTDLSPAQEAFACGLAQVAEVGVALPWEEGHPATEVLTPLVKRLAERGRHEHVGSPDPEGELARLEHALYRPGTPHAPTGAVVLAEAAGRDLEVVLAVDIAADHIERGVPAGHVAIVFREAGSRVALVEAAAKQAGVDVQTDVALPLAGTPMGTALLALVDAACGREPSRERLLAYLASPYSGVDATHLERADAAWRRTRAAGSRMLADAGRMPGCGHAVRLARALSGAPLTSRNARHWQSLIDMLLASADARRGLSHAAGSWDCAVQRAAVSTLAALAEGIGEDVGGAEVRAALARAPVSSGGPEREDAVVFTEAHRVRGRRFDVVILGGLSAGEFSPERPRPLATELLDGLGLPSGSDERAAERLLFYTVATRPRTALHLVRQSTDANGEALRPSAFWEEVLDLYRTPGGGDPERHPEGLPVEVRPLTVLGSDSVAYTPGRRAERMAGPRRPWRPRRGALVSPTARAALQDIDEFSVSELEAYAACPYRWFVERAVRPREIDAAFEAREAGSLAHGVLAAFYERWSTPEAPRRVTPESLPEAQAVLGEVLYEAVESGPRTIGLAEELTVDKVRRWVADAIADDALLLPGYVPLACEFAFGRAEERPFEFGGVALRGRIDRIDRRGGGLVVTDYKSAGVVPGHGSFDSRGIMQLPVYLAAASALLDGEPDGAIFRSLSSRTARGFWRADRLSLLECGSRTDAVGPDEVSGILGQAADRVAAAAEGIRTGHIAPVQGGCSACASCSARAVCREAGNA